MYLNKIVNEMLKKIRKSINYLFLRKQRNPNPIKQIKTV